jgi:hypothetical protein
LPRQRFKSIDYKKQASIGIIIAHLPNFLAEIKKAAALNECSCMSFG